MSRYLFILSVAGVLMATLAATPAKADSIIDTFVWVPCHSTITSPDFCGPQQSGPVEYTWQAPASPTPTSSCDPSDVLVYCFNITADASRSGTDLGPQTISFSSVAGVTDFSIQGLGIMSFQSPAWAGPDTSPSFLPGSYLGNLDDVVSPQAGTLNIFSAVDTPEPSTVLQTGIGLLLGLGIVGLWRKRVSSIES